MGLNIVRGLVVAVVLLNANAALAAKAAKAEGSPPSGRRLPSKVTFHKSPSEESRAERAQRLKRECKGRPDAGACLGFATR
ncbi:MULTISPECIES: hypothetical protein [Hydrogenophaga]|jgi:hypothetical protein|uniref:Uncharacterized protein n=1 Tax=Hydrogenophaga intermedia TaxID=65786 RepID=A0A1L1PNL7_HYDIT|nr:MULTISPECIES: hypothetical protein [Hydrogenophaga]AOS81396.1 hypothetical protein Q5W_21790 [Hydrogenophaga sp. PBC]TMU74144.1 hypothetical protein FGJ01_13845 [Hydrogenophaga intermedia]CDN87626.1 hypothetical protein BN948_02051 [Hydrogenophaga intermedia]